jgi:hypothetical protein
MPAAGCDIRAKLTVFRGQIRLACNGLNQSRWLTTYDLKVIQVTLRDVAEA